ncbi:MAG: hypothetical protein IPM16_08755 [Chloroflexi bacterium]|nr:hypothetical protein [Chloroflexota bacterium]
MDTGAQISLLPLEILDLLEDAGSPQTRISLEQAGITRHSFEAVEARIALQFEDLEGNVSEVITAPCWFADTEVALIGFEGVLDRAVLHIDYPGRIGWIDV